MGNGATLEFGIADIAGSNERTKGPNTVNRVDNLQLVREL